ncbi:MAG: CHAT domain-containing protein, partial [Pseudomonadota bacterium]
LSAGDAGDIRIQANHIQLRTQGNINSAAINTGQGGDITLDANTLEMNNGAIIAGSVGQGDSGQIHIRTMQSRLDSLSLISTSAIQGSSGDITFEASENLTLSDHSGLLTQASGNTLQTGDAGNIFISTPNLTLLQGSVLETSAANTGGGDIQLKVPNILRLSNSRIGAMAAGMSSDDSGGNVEIDSPRLLLMDSSTIRAGAVAGQGGDIRIAAGQFVATVDSVLDASSQLSVDGNISISADAVQLAEDLQALPTGYLSERTTVVQACKGLSGDAIGNLTTNLMPSNVPTNIGLRQHGDNLLLTQGNQQFIQAQLEQALTHYQAAQQSNNPLVQAKAQLNIVLVKQNLEQFADVEQALTSARRQLETLPLDDDVVLEWLALAETGLQFGIIEKLPFGLKQSNNEQLQVLTALLFARQLAAKNQPNKALALARHTLFRAQTMSAPEFTYRAHQLLGQLLATQAQQDAALAQYRHAQRLLGELRPIFLKRYPDAYTFRQYIAVSYFELADTLLKRAANVEGNSLKQALLKESRNVIEAFKASELENYFRDECVVALEQNMAQLDRVIAPGTAVLYPIVLPDRVELLVSLAGDIHRFSITGAREDLYSQVSRFLSTFNRRDAYRLYQWLLAPAENLLQKAQINTLVIASHGPLLSLPFAALYDGESYLIERYALAMSPGLTLTNTAPLDRKNIKILLGGVTTFPKQVVADSNALRSGFSPLPKVGRELDAIHQLFGGKVLRDQEFAIENIQTSLTDEAYQIVHFATHGEFHAQPEQSYVLAYDEKMTLPQLETWIQHRRFRQQPLELLTLSACHTARGDDMRAVLGLAGLTIQAGAKSALAGLWAVDDAATAELMPRFYQFLQNPSPAQTGLQDQNWEVRKEALWLYTKLVEVNPELAEQVLATTQTGLLPHILILVL